MSRGQLILCVEIYCPRRLRSCLYMFIVLLCSCVYNNNLGYKYIYIYIYVRDLIYISFVHSLLDTFESSALLLELPVAY